MPKRRIAFVVHRYGADVVGGSEAVVREAAIGFAGRGWDVEVFTSAARDVFTWATEYSLGESDDEGVTVRRFPVSLSSRKRVKYSLDRRIMSGERISIDEQMTWINSWFRMPELFQALVASADDFDAIVFAPYLFWPTAVGTAIAPERSIVMPCFHDEVYAYLDIFRNAVARCRGTWFLAEPERDLALQLGAVGEHHAITGAGVPIPTTYDAEGFRERHGLDRPFILYAGRREAGKGWDVLLSSYNHLMHQSDIGLDLVTVGTGQVHAPPGIEKHVRDLAFLDASDVPNAFAAASAYVQPSANESFSRTTMEAWLAGTPVIANEAGRVVAWHCRRSGAGVTWRDVDELVECIRFVGEAPDAARELAAPGRKYVLENYDWPVVLDKMETAIAEMQ